MIIISTIDVHIWPIINTVVTVQKNTYKLQQNKTGKIVAKVIHDIEWIHLMPHATHVA